MEKPDDVLAIVVTDLDDEPVGVLEKWSDEAWFYAPVEDFEDLN